MERAYVTALVRALSKEGADEKAIVDGLVAHLKARGRLKLLPRILSALERHMKQEGAKAPRIEIAQEEDRARAMALAKEDGVHTDTVVINDSLLSGFRIRNGTLLTDRSGKRALVDLYRNITNA